MVGTNYTQHVLILANDAPGARHFAEELLSQPQPDDIRYTLIHPDAAQILLRLQGITALETSAKTQTFLDTLKTADGLICLQPIETGLCETLIPQLEEAGIKRAIFCTREGNYHPPDPHTLLMVHLTVQKLVTSNLDWTLLRPTTICGGMDDPLARLSRQIHRLHRRHIFVGSHVLRNFIQPLHERDLARAILNAFPNARTFRQIYGLSGQKPIKVGQAIKAICARNGTKCHILPLLGRQWLLPKWLLFSRKNQPLKLTKLHHSIITTHEKAFRDFGFIPQTPIGLIKDDPS